MVKKKPFRPFSAMGEKIDPDIREYISAVGVITLAWAHHEMVLDVMVGIDQHLGRRKKKKRHPSGAVGKVGILEDALIAREAYTAPYKQEMIQIISMTRTAAERRNVLVHGAIISQLSEAKATVIKLTRDGDEDTLKEHETSIHELFVLFQMIVELTGHSWNLVIRILRAEVPEAAEVVATIGLLDTSKFDWPAINEIALRRERKTAVPDAKGLKGDPLKRENLPPAHPPEAVCGEYSPHPKREGL